MLTYSEWKKLNESFSGSLGVSTIPTIVAFGSQVPVEEGKAKEDTVEVKACDDCKDEEKCEKHCDDCKDDKKCEKHCCKKADDDKDDKKVTVKMTEAEAQWFNHVKSVLDYKAAPKQEITEGIINKNKDFYKSFMNLILS